MVTIDGGSDHNSILLQMDLSEPKPSTPFKFYLGWMNEPDFKEIIIKEWDTFNPLLNGGASRQFVDALK